jgi:soluble lytic murein transglycosylase-like protein
MMSRCKDLIKLSVVYLISIFILFSCHPAHANTPEWITHVTKGKVKYTEAMKIVKWVYAYSVQYEIDPNLIFRLIKVESTFNRKARSKADGQGLMQVVPKWHREKLKGKNLYTVKDNIEVGTKILRQYKDQYPSINRALRAYNGSHRSNVYPRKIMSVKLINYETPYPGSDDRPKQLVKEETKMLDIKPIF